MSKLPTKGKISAYWLDQFIINSYDFYDENLGNGARSFFEDLLHLGLINDEKIDWDSEALIAPSKKQVQQNG